ncbi:MAG: hypothetical protein WCS37_12545 [Chloroflexota bacterium]|nr:hypothetical protein [Chloroflexota bacterium]
MTNPDSNRGEGTNVNTKKFQPERYLEQRNGITYLPLKWRLAWLRAEHPQAKVETKLVKHKEGMAIFRAEIKLPEGASATGWGSKRDPYVGEEGSSNGDLSLSYITEAENHALGRALEVMGYGIEYASDFDLPADGEPIPLREEQDEEEATIEVPMNSKETDVVGDEEAEEIAGTVRIIAEPPPTPIAETIAEEAEVETEEEVEEVASSNSRPQVLEEPARYSSEPTPFRPSRQPAPATGANPPTLITSHPAANRRPNPTPLEPPVAPVPNPNPIINPVVEERLKGITDSQLILAIKQIFYEARRLHNLNEDAVDRNCQKRYGVLVNGLPLDQANEYLERIKNAPRTPKK